MSTRPSSAARRITVPCAVLLAEVRVPGVEVRVEIHEGERAVTLRRGPQLRQQHAVVAAEGQRQHAGAVQGRERLLHALVGALARARHHRRVAVVDHREALEHAHPLRRVVARAQRQRALADGLGAEARPGAEAHRGVEGQTDRGHVHAFQARLVRQAQEGGDARRSAASPGDRRDGSPSPWPPLGSAAIIPHAPAFAHAVAAPACTRRRPRRRLTGRGTMPPTMRLGTLTTAWSSLARVARLSLTSPRGLPACTPAKRPRRSTVPHHGGWSR